MRTENSRAATNVVDKHPQNERKTLQVLQQAAGKDKENLVGAGRTLRSTANAKESLQIVKEIIDEKQTILSEHLKESSVAHTSKRQRKMPSASSIVKGKSKVKAEDLMSAGSPSEKYWSVVAEKRRVALETALEENRVLHEQVALLLEENETKAKKLDETEHLLDLLRGMLAGDDTDVDMSTDVSTNDIVDSPTDDAVDEADEDGVNVAADCSVEY